MPDTPEQRSVELWECEKCGTVNGPTNGAEYATRCTATDTDPNPPRSINESKGVGSHVLWSKCGGTLTGPHRYVPESESINKAEMVEWLEERVRVCLEQLEDREAKGMSMAILGRYAEAGAAYDAVRRHINESEEA